MSADESPLEATLRAFRERDLAGLASGGGLPAGLGLASVLGILGGDPESRVRHFLGSPVREAFWTPVAVPDYHRVRVWSRDDRVVKVVGERPSLPVDALGVLGPPGLHLEEQQEEVWAERGIAVAINPSRTVITALTIFPSLSPVEYRRDLATFVQRREWE